MGDVIQFRKVRKNNDGRPTLNIGAVDMNKIGSGILTVLGGVFKISYKILNGIGLLMIALLGLAILNGRRPSGFIRIQYLHEYGYWDDAGFCGNQQISIDDAMRNANYNYPGRPVRAVDSNGRVICGY